eukprot:gnl/MRDRNA2_/MRDRNA2_29648_c0_seq1.p1 gnl/MRDRNA2_/MRDRNA2_29648_c0~~gnl/MRDRNA2_/MRDRNA2_29648_c0_seq1.p1  ORF type:complete len:1261 (+),score=312.69 gnl/MRDRNA2_/MRDRNA2_29648_c0_seq1:321-3785(+)
MLDSLKAAVEMRDQYEYYESDQEDEPDEEELRFQREFEAQLGLSFGDDSGQMSRPSSRRPSPDPDDNDEVDLEGLLEDIDDKTPVARRPKAKPASRRPSPKPDSEESASRHEAVPDSPVLRQPEPQRASNPYEDIVNEPEPRASRARSRTPPVAESTDPARAAPQSRPASRQESQPPSRRGTPPSMDVDNPQSHRNTPPLSDTDPASQSGSTTQEKPVDAVVNRRTKMLQLFGSKASLHDDQPEADAPQGRRSGPSSPQVDSRVGSRAATPPLMQDPLATHGFSEQDAGRGASAEPRLSSKSPAPSSGGDLDSLLQPKPKRKLGRPKGKAAPDEALTGHPSFESRTPPKERDTPEAASPPPLPPSQPGSPRPESVSAGALPMFDEEDSGGLDDLLGDNSAPAKPAPQAPASAQPRVEPKEDSDDGLPDFLSGRDQPRARRGDPKPPAPDPAKRSSLASLGFSDDEVPPDSPMESPMDRSMDPPLFSANAPPTPREAPNQATQRPSMQVDTSAPSYPIPLSQPPASQNSPAGSSAAGINQSPSGTPLGDTNLDDLLAARAKPQGRRLSRAKAKALAQSGSPQAKASMKAPQTSAALTPGLQSVGSTALPTGGTPSVISSSQPGAAVPDRLLADQQALAGHHEGRQTFSFSDMMQLKSGAQSAAENAGPTQTLDPRTQAVLAQALEPPTSPDKNLLLNLHQSAPYPQTVPPFPPMSMAPSSDVLQKFAYSEAKVRQLELQLQEQEQRWHQRMTESKMQWDAEKERMEHSCKRMESELDRLKDVHSADMRHLNENKAMMLQNFELEKDTARRDERRKAEVEIERVKADAARDLEDQRLQHERAVKIIREQSDLENESVKKSFQGVAQLDSLMSKVQGSAEEVEKMSRKVEADKVMEHNLRERQLVIREQNVQELESRLKAQTKEVEEQRRRMTELMTSMKEKQVDERTDLSLERDRLEAEHRRLEELQITLRDSDRSAKEQLRHSWAKLEDEKRSFHTEKVRFESDMSAQKEEMEARQRRIQHEVDRIKLMHDQVETARANSSNRIRESEIMIAGERRCLMNDLEIFEEKKRTVTDELEKLQIDRKALDEERKCFDEERLAVGQMALVVQQRSADMAQVSAEVGNAKEELERLRQQLASERSMQSSEMEAEDNANTC